LYDPRNDDFLKQRNILFKNFNGNWYIEVNAFAHGITKIGLGLFYKGALNEITKAVFDSVKEAGIGDEAQDFVLTLRRDDDPWDVHGAVQITKDHFETITGLKALSIEEYFWESENVPQYYDIGATLIDFTDR